MITADLKLRCITCGNRFPCSCETHRPANDFDDVPTVVIPRITTRELVEQHRAELIRAGLVRATEQEVETKAVGK